MLDREGCASVQVSITLITESKSNLNYSDCANTFSSLQGLLFELDF